MEEENNTEHPRHLSHPPGWAKVAAPTLILSGNRRVVAGEARAHFSSLVFAILFGLEIKTRAQPLQTTLGAGLGQMQHPKFPCHKGIPDPSLSFPFPPSCVVEVNFVVTVFPSLRGSVKK